MEPISLGILLAAMAAGGTGKLWEKKDAAEQAQREAEARNNVLSQTLARTDMLSGASRGMFNGTTAGFSAPVQDAQLAGSQNDRSNFTTSHMTAADPSAVAINPDAPPVVKGEIAKRMAATFGQATDRAKALGKLGGYGDTWLKNNTNVADTARNVAVNNNAAEGEYATLGPKQDLAQQAAYKPPSIWPQLLQGAASIAGAYAGSGRARSMFAGAPSQSSIEQ